jgi:hypothetical protein
MTLNLYRNVLDGFLGEKDRAALLACWHWLAALLCLEAYRRQRAEVCAYRAALLARTYHCGLASTADLEAAAAERLTLALQPCALVVQPCNMVTASMDTRQVQQAYDKVAVLALANAAATAENHPVTSEPNEALPEDIYSGMTYRQLQAECKRRGIKGLTRKADVLRQELFDTHGK